jgi:hypothetical protein
MVLGMEGVVKEICHFKRDNARSIAVVKMDKVSMRVFVKYDTLLLFALSK